MLDNNEVTRPPVEVYPSWKQQAEAYQFCEQRNDKNMLAMDMGTGKSKVTIDRIQNSGYGMTIIICPPSVMGVWRREIERHWNTEKVAPPLVLILDRPRDTCKTKAAKVAKMSTATHAAQRIIVTNYQSAFREPLASALVACRPTLVVCDESHRIKSSSGKWSRYCHKLASDKVPHRLALSGTPMAHSPLDLFGQFRFVDRNILGWSYTAFRSRFAVVNQMFPSQVMRWVNEDLLRDIFHQHAYVCEAGEVLDLPGIIFDDRFCELSPASKRVYDDLRQRLISEVRDSTITVPNALVKVLRLQQVTSGFVSWKDDLDEDRVEVLGREKSQLLKDTLEDIDNPVVVFCRFTRDLAAVRKVAKSLGRRYGELSARQRDLTPHAEMPNNIDVLGVQLQAGGEGIDLTRARYGIYYSMGFSLGDYKQSIARIYRPGQVHPVTIYHLLARGTVDEIVHKALHERQEVIDVIFKKIIETGGL